MIRALSSTGGVITMPVSCSPRLAARCAAADHATRSNTSASAMLNIAARTVIVPSLAFITGEVLPGRVVSCGGSHELPRQKHCARNLAEQEERRDVLTAVARRNAGTSRHSARALLTRSPALLHGFACPQAGLHGFVAGRDHRRLIDRTGRSTTVPAKCTVPLAGARTVPVVGDRFHDVLTRRGGWGDERARHRVGESTGHTHRVGRFQMWYGHQVARW